MADGNRGDSAPRMGATGEVGLHPLRSDTAAAYLLMGTKNRERRRMKQSKRRKRAAGASKRAGGQSGARGLQGPADADVMVDELILAAAHADCEGSGDGTHLRSLIDALAQGMGLEGGRDLVARRLDSLLQSDIARVLDSGWAPHEITRVVRRRAGATAASIMAGPLAEVASGRHPRGGTPCPRLGQSKSVRKLDPASSSWEADLSMAIAAFSVLEHLPVLPDLGGIRSRTRNVRSHEEERMFTRIRGLLTKAESSDYAEEVDAFMAKAQELMTRYCIDRTMVEADAEGDGVQQVDAAACGWRTRISKLRRSCWPTSPARTDAGLLSIRYSVSPPWSGIQRTSTQRTCSLRPYSCRRCGASPLLEGSDVRPPLPEAIVPPIFLRGVCREDRFSPVRSQRGRDRGGRQRLRQLPIAGPGPSGGTGRCRCRGSVRRAGRTEILTHGCRRVGGRHGGGRHGRARGSQKLSYATAS